MKALTLRPFFFVALAYLAGVQINGWRSDASISQGPAAYAPVTAAKATDNLRTIKLPHFEPELPPAAGRDEFLVVCISCHSARYVMMQPLFPRRQWEETVSKMAKVYGAQMSEEQKQAILGYLVIINGIATKSNASGLASDDEDSAAITGTLLPQHPEPYPLLKVSNGAAEHLAEVNRGADLFGQDCAGCHGAAGRGDGLVGQVLSRRPADLTAFHFSVEFLSKSLWNGVRGSSMPSWRNLSEPDLSAIAAFVQSLHRPANAPKPAPESLAQGRTLFLQNCSPCHGLLGDGKSAIAATLSPPPANFHLKQPDFEHILQVLHDGVPGTAMPSWKDQISETDRAALAGFVRSLYEPTNLNDR